MSDAPILIGGKVSNEDAQKVVAVAIDAHVPDTIEQPTQHMLNSISAEVTAWFHFFHSIEVEAASFFYVNSGRIQTILRVKSSMARTPEYTYSHSLPCVGQSGGPISAVITTNDGSGATGGATPRGGSGASPSGSGYDGGSDGHAAGDDAETPSGGQGGGSIGGGAA